MVMHDIFGYELYIFVCLYIYITYLFIYLFIYLFKYVCIHRKWSNKDAYAELLAKD